MKQKINNLAMSMFGLMVILVAWEVFAEPAPECTTQLTAKAYQRSFESAQQMVMNQFDSLALSDAERCAHYATFEINIKYAHDNLRLPPGATDSIKCRYIGQKDGMIKSLETIAALCREM